jgi:hypothetical protein
MELVLTRQFAVGDATIGTLTLDGAFECWTLEDVIRERKVYGKTAIPAGCYPVLLCESPRFSDSYEKRGLGRIVPLIDKVPNYSGVRIHVGNVAEHTHGCVLVGQSWDKKSPKIGASVAAFKHLMTALGKAKGMLRITIRNEVASPDAGTRHPSKPVWDGMFRGARPWHIPA